MSILTGTEIVRMRDLGRLVIEPFNMKQVNPNSYNLRLGNKLKRYDSVRLDPKIENKTYDIEIDDVSGFTLEPGRGYLGETVERAGSDQFVCHVDGRSSIGRLFLLVHCTAARGDIGWTGRWTLELIVVGDQPVVVYAGMEIAQATFHSVIGETSIQYKGKYAGATEVQASRIHKDYENKS